jgi:hypothetical protein
VKWSLLLIATILHAQPIKPDTRTLAATLKAARAAQTRESFLAWVDARLKNPEQVDSFNRELRRAGINGPGRDEFWGTDNVGLLQVTPIPTAPDLFAIRLGIGVASGYDETVVFYHRQPWHRIGWLNDDLSTKEYSQFSSIAVSEKDANGNRLIASSGFAIDRRYTGPFTVKFRIDRLEPASLKTLLSKEMTAEYNYVPGHDGLEDLFAKASVEGNVATFRYSHRMHNEEYEPAILRYSVSGTAVTRIAPLAITRSGFLDEWISLDPRDVAQWSAPESLKGHHPIKEFLKQHENDDHIYFNKISLCSNSPRTWQISASSGFNAPTATWYFLLTESGAANMRMLGVKDNPNPECVEHDLDALTEELFLQNP